MLRYATPEYVLVALVALKVYHRVSKRYKRSLGVPCHSFVWLYLFLLYLFFRALHFVCTGVFPKVGLLDPDLVEARANASWVEINDTWAKEHWHEEASLRDYDFLRWMSVVSPFWVGATFVVCLWHMWKHAQQMRRAQTSPGRRDERFVLHDLTIQVLILPALYGLMSLNGVLFMWGIILDDHGATEDSEVRRFPLWSQRADYYTEMYDNAFFIADIYESFALLVLGHVVMRVLQQRVRQDYHEERANGQPCADIPTTISAMKLMTEMKELTTFGIKFFCWTCGLQALYQLVLTTMGYYGILDEIFAMGDPANERKPGLLHTKVVESKSKYFFLGAGFVASFAAIGNVVKVETAFHHQLREFQPFWKFWGTKIIVSIGFLQSMVLWVLPPFSWWSLTRQNLFYASLLCFECFLVSLMHLKAWAHDQTWYEGFIHSGSRSGSSSTASDDIFEREIEIEHSDSAEEVTLEDPENHPRTPSAKSPQSGHVALPGSAQSPQVGRVAFAFLSPALSVGAEGKAATTTRSPLL